MAINKKRFQLPSPVYTKLADLSKKDGQMVNIFGIVKFFKSPCKSKGSDFCLSVSLVDDSYQNTDKKFVCNIFCPFENELPLVRSVGDILKLDGIKVSRYRGEVQGKGTSSLSWVSFDGYSNYTSYCSKSSMPNYSITDQDKQILHDLKTWQSSFKSIQPQFYKKTLSQIDHNVAFFNIACQVVSICLAVNNCVRLTIWDGTKPTCQSYCLEDPLENTLMADCSIQHDAEGMTVDMFLYDEHASGEVNSLQPGDFVLLNNVHTKPENVLSKERNLPVMSFILHKGRINGRGVLKLQQDSYLVKELEQQFHLYKTNKPTKPTSTLREENTARTMQTSCTVTDFPLIPFTNIANIKNCSQIPNKFRCRVKVIAFLPCNVKDFVQKCCRNCRQVSFHQETKRSNNLKRKLWESDTDSMGSLSPSESSQDEGSQDEQETNANTECSLSNLQQQNCSTCNEEMSLVYMFSLLIEDITGVLDVMIFDQNARHFLPELPSPEEFLAQPEIQKSVYDNLISITDNLTNELCGDSESSLCQRPWLECCVFSYQVQGRGVFYRIFGTSVV